MLRIIIVDDEASIREGLAKMIGKENDSFHITGTFSNGQDALSFVQASDIDVVITDIRMPFVDGLELIKQLKALQPAVRCIMMSGFTDFEYAREALRYSAVDYLLKPISKKQLFKLLYMLDDEKITSLEKEQRFRSGMLLSYLRSSSSQCSTFPELSLLRPYYAVYVFRSTNMEMLRAQVNLLSQQMTVPLDIVDPGDGMLVLISYYSVEPLPELIQQLPDQLRPSLVPAGTVHIGVSRGYDRITRLSLAYDEAVCACDCGLYSQSNWSCHHIGDLPQPELNITDWFAHIKEPLKRNLQILNIPAIKSELKEQYNQLQQAKASRQAITSLCRLINDLALAELPEWKKLHLPAAAGQWAEELSSCFTFEEMRELFLGRFLSGLEQIRAQRLNMADRSVETVKRWITEHYDQQAELSSLAALVYLTPSYLSKLFKNETGMTITDYLIEVRIEKAKLLLKTCLDMKIHEIGCQVGYPDPAYFNKLFKRIVGITPNEYKKINPY
ncbi:response regulator [Paenibacillus fonticola]|uniref:response regulator n=1 Tax=Paenibacillus fonticola TaxID=379896 RepID=UPI000381DC45|nr:response regulator [Paenibacillus fonticola]